MRIGILILATCVMCLPVAATAQTYSRPTASRSTASQAESVIRQAPMDGWRNYVTVPDGPCGYPMSVEADCYTGCDGCCFRPLVFLHNVKRMLSCFVPCNLCCRGGHGGNGGCGGCGPLHGCILGGRGWGGCSVCCGGPVDVYGPGYGGGVGGGGGGGCGCGVNPCGSAFAPPTHGGHCFGCSSVVPGDGEMYIEEQALPPPKPTASPTPTGIPAPEVRRTRPSRAQPAQYQEPAPARASSKPSVLRRASAEEELKEPAPLFIDLPRVKPIVRSQTPEAVDSVEIPVNPLRRR